MDRDEVVKMYTAGLTTDDIAVELDVAPKEVKDLLIEEGLLMKQGRKSSAEGLSDEDRMSVALEYTEEKTPAVQIIAKWHITWNAFYKILEEQHVPYREMKVENALARDRRLDRAVQMYIGGARIWEIENETGIRQPVLHSTLHSRGIPLRRVAGPSII